MMPLQHFQRQRISIQPTFNNKMLSCVLHLVIFLRILGTLASYKISGNRWHHDWEVKSIKGKGLSFGYGLRYQVIMEGLVYWSQNFPKDVLIFYHCAYQSFMVRSWTFYLPASSKEGPGQPLVHFCLIYFDNVTDSPPLIIYNPSQSKR